MTIGPEPISRIFWRSSLRGIPRLGPRDEAVEQVDGVVGPWPGLRVVLNRRRRHIAQTEPLHRAVVEVDVGQLGAPELGLPLHGLVSLNCRRAVGADDG